MFFDKQGVRFEVLSDHQLRSLAESCGSPWTVDGQTCGGLWNRLQARGEQVPQGFEDYCGSGWRWKNRDRGKVLADGSITKTAVETTVPTGRRGESLMIVSLSKPDWDGETLELIARKVIKASR